MTYSLRDFGSYTVGGRLVTVSGRPRREVSFTPSTRYMHDPNGTFAAEAAYVQYFVPERRRDRPPVVLLHGGGMTGSIWESTPDGRKGWLHHLLDRGLEVHVVDNVERGRAGWIPGLWPGEPVMRSLEEAWTLFRFGDTAGFDTRLAFPGQRFPVDCLEAFARGFVPRWTSTTDAQVTAFLALLERLGTASIVCHSQGGEIALRALAAAPARVAAVVAIEPSGTPVLPGSEALPPIRLLYGDYLSVDPIWEALLRGWTALAERHADVSLLDLSDAFPGTSHMAMLDRGTEAVAALVADAML